MELIERCTLAITFPAQGVTHEVAADTFTDAGRQHSILERVAQAVEGMLLGFEQPVLSRELVDGVGEGRAICVAWEPVRALPEGFEADAKQWDHAPRIGGFQGASDRLNRDVRNIGIQPDLSGSKTGPLAWPVSGVDHTQEDAAGFGVEAVQRTGAEDLLLDPVGAERRSGDLFALIKIEAAGVELDLGAFALGGGDSPKGRGHIDHILVGGVGGNFAIRHPVHPPRPELEQIGGGDFKIWHVFDDLDEVPDSLDARVSGPSYLIFGLSDESGPLMNPVFLKGIANRHGSDWNAAQQGLSLDHIDNI